MTIDPRTPVIVGVGQVTRRPTGPDDRNHAVDLMVEAVERAGQDGSTRVLGAIDLVAVVAGDWPLADPGREVARRVGSAGARTASTPYGGNLPQHLVGELATRIQAGALDVGVVVGGEIGYSQRITGEKPWQREAIGPPPDERIGEPVPWWTKAEQRRGLTRPIEAYALVESALAGATGGDVAGHRDRVAELWSGLNEVACGNELAWSRERLATADLRDGSPANPMVMFPYTRAMAANPYVDQAAAVIVTSAARAQGLGVPAERWVFPHASATAHDTLDLAARADLHRSPALAAAATRTLAHGGVGLAEVAHLDLYSCFPSAVQVAATELGASGRQLTVTGGLAFFGGPHNDYVTHAIASMADVVRADPGSLGLVTANGGYLTKHAAGLYATRPPARPFAFLDVQAEVDVHPTRPVAHDHVGRVVVEAHTAPPSGRTLFSCLTPRGARTWAWSEDPAAHEAATTGHMQGTEGHLAADGELRL